MHLVDVSIGHYGSSSIVGGGIPIGTGMALAIQMKKKPLVSTVFFSDGAADEGVLYESINFAVLKRLPVVYVLENNQYSVCSPVSARQAGDNVFHTMSPPSPAYPEKLTAMTCSKSTKPPGAPWNAPVPGWGLRSSNARPTASGDMPGANRRISRAIGHWKRWKIGRHAARYFLSRRNFWRQGVITGEETTTMEKRIDAELDEAFSCARKDPLPDGKNLHLHLFCE